MSGVAEGDERSELALDFPGTPCYRPYSSQHHADYPFFRPCVFAVFIR